eukprot:EG_transcript_18879
MALWDDFLAKLRGSKYTCDDIAGRPDEDIPAILKELGFRSAQRAKLQTQWKERRGELKTPLSPRNGLAAAAAEDGAAAAEASGGEGGEGDADEEPLEVRRAKLRAEKKGKRPREGEETAAAQSRKRTAKPDGAEALAPRLKRPAPAASQLVQCPVAAPPTPMGPDALRVPLRAPAASDTGGAGPGLAGAKFCACGYYVLPSDSRCPSCASPVPAGPRAFHSLFKPQANRLDVVDEFRTKTADHRSMTLAFCEKCWKSTRCYTDSLQTRSADEGLTTFYSCSVCKYNWLEYS